MKYEQLHVVFYVDILLCGFILDLMPTAYFCDTDKKFG